MYASNDLVSKTVFSTALYFSDRVDVLWIDLKLCWYALGGLWYEEPLWRGVLPEGTRFLRITLKTFPRWSNGWTLQLFLNQHCKATFMTLISFYKSKWIVDTIIILLSPPYSSFVHFLSIWTSKLSQRVYFISLTVLRQNKTKTFTGFFWLILFSNNHCEHTNCHQLGLILLFHL